jgi:CRP-like cAMP-binding protein
MIFAQGEPADAAFYVNAGQVKICAPSRAGKDKLLQIVGRGSFLGLSCLVGRSQRLITATTITECRVVRLEGPLFVDYKGELRVHRSLRNVVMQDD